MEEQVKIRFFGDFTTGENYQAKYDVNQRKNVLRQKGYDYLLKDTKQFFEGSYNIINLESPITDCISSDLEGRKAVLHWMDPEIAGDFLVKYGINSATLGNNHAYDYGKAGLIQTLGILDNFGIEHFGAGLDKVSAGKPFVKTFQVGSKSVNLYVFGGYKYREDYDLEFDFYAKDNKPGVFLLTPETICDEISNIKKNDKDSFVVIFPHFGFDLQKTNEHQIKYSKAWIDSGADLVIGHGPHMMNRIEYYREKPIVYSLGNFLFPSDFRDRMSPYNMIFELALVEEKGQINTKYKLYPLYFNTNSTAPVMRPIDESEINGFLSMLTDNNDAIMDRINVVQEDIIWIEI